MNRHERRQAAASGAHAHKLILKTAQDMAHSLYDDLVKDNARWEQFRDSWPAGTTEAQARVDFVGAMAPNLLSEARDTLARLLNTNLSSVLKDEIADALILDNALMRGRHAGRNLI